MSVAAQFSNLLGLAAHTIRYQIREATFRGLAKLIIMRRLLADHIPATAVPGVEPDRSRRGRSGAAVEAHPRPHLDKRAALRQLRLLFVFHSHQRAALIVLQHTDRAHGNPVASSGLADDAPLSRRKKQTRRQDWRKHDGNDKERFFHRLLSIMSLQATTLRDRTRSVNVSSAPFKRP